MVSLSFSDPLYYILLYFPPPNSLTHYTVFGKTYERGGRYIQNRYLKIAHHPPPPPPLFGDDATINLHSANLLLLRTTTTPRNSQIAVVILSKSVKFIELFEVRIRIIISQRCGGCCCCSAIWMTPFQMVLFLVWIVVVHIAFRRSLILISHLYGTLFVAQSEHALFKVTTAIKHSTTYIHILYSTFQMGLYSMILWNFKAPQTPTHLHRCHLPKWPLLLLMLSAWWWWMDGWRKGREGLK